MPHQELHKLFLASQALWLRLYRSVEQMPHTAIVDWRQAMEPMVALERTSLEEKGISLDDRAVIKHIT